LKAKRRTVKKIFIAEAQDASAVLDAIEFEAQRQRVPVHMVSMTRLDREAKTEGHQGVMALAHALDTVSLDDLLKVAKPFLLVCDGVTDPRNLGAMLRSADGAGVTGVVVPRHRSARISPTVTKTAAGAIEYLTFCDVGGIPSAIDQLNKAGVFTVGLAGDAKDSGCAHCRRRREGTFFAHSQTMRDRCVDTTAWSNQFVERGRRRFDRGF
jgi:23S rRNA (guanosine2251-2'-O)-methyltransferase